MGDLKEGESKYINYASLTNANVSTGLMYGTIKLTVQDANGTVRLGGENNLLDNYGFEPHKGKIL